MNSLYGVGSFRSVCRTIIRTIIDCDAVDSFDLIYYGIYLLQLGFHPVAVIGKSVQNY